MICNVCKCQINEKAGDIIGYIGTIKVALCVTCFNGLGELYNYE